MEGVALLLAAAATAHLLARRLSLPVLPLMLGAGWLLARLHAPPAGVVGDALTLGAALLLFLGGMELDVGRLGRRGGASLRVGTAQFLLLGGSAFGLALLLGFGRVEAVFLALALTASSTLVCVRLLQRRAEMFEPAGRLVLGVLLLQDVLVLLLVPLAAGMGEGTPAILRSLLALALLGASVPVVHRWLPPLLLRIQEEEELLVLASLSVLFAYLGAAHLLELPLVVGAFLAGVGLARFPLREIVRVELAPVGDFFAALFFVALGAIVGLPAPTILLRATAFVLLVVALTPPLVALVAERQGLAARSAVEAGLLLSQTSEISLVIGLAGLQQGRIGSETFTVIALVTMGTMLVTPLLSTPQVAARLMPLHPSRWLRREGGTGLEDHVVLLGLGSTAFPLLDLLMMEGRRVVVVDHDPVVLRPLLETPVCALRGDATDPGILVGAGVERARTVVSTLSRVRDNGPVLELVRPGTPVLIRVFEEEEARWVRDRGGLPILLAEEGARSFLDWFQRAGERLPAVDASGDQAQATRPP